MPDRDANVLPAWYLRCAGTELPFICRCQYGPSAHCAHGRCDLCAHRTNRAWYDRPLPETYMVNRRGGAIADVWLLDVWAGRRPGCRWRCSCDCHTRPPRQAALFDTETP